MGRKILVGSSLLILAIGASLYFFKKPNESETPPILNNSTSSEALVDKKLFSEVRFAVYPFMNPDLPMRRQGTVTFSDEERGYSLDTIPEGGPAAHNIFGPNGWIGDLKFLGGVASYAFSPNHQYVAFEARQRLSSSTANFNILVVNLSNGEYETLPFPATSNDSNAIPYIEAFSWSTNSTLDFTFYFIRGSGNDYYYGTMPPQRWRYNIVDKNLTNLHETSSRFLEVESSCGIEASNKTETSEIPIYGLPTVLRIDNEEFHRMAICGGIKIEQQNHQYTVSDKEDKIIYQQRQFWGGFLADVSFFAYKERKYFILMGGDCGNKFCNYEYYMFYSDSEGNAIPIKGSGTFYQSLWTASQTVGVRVYSYDDNLYLIVEDGNYPYAVVIDKNNSFVGNINRNTTSTLVGPIPPKIQEIISTPRG